MQLTTLENFTELLEELKCFNHYLLQYAICNDLGYCILYSAGKCINVRLIDGDLNFFNTPDTRDTNITIYRGKHNESIKQIVKHPVNRYTQQVKYEIFFHHTNCSLRIYALMDTGRRNIQADLPAPVTS